MSRIVTGGGERFEALTFSDKALEIVHLCKKTSA
jgi:hypothetical protein